MQAALQKPIELNAAASATEQQAALSQRLLIVWEARKKISLRDHLIWHVLSNTDFTALEEQIDIFKLLVPYIDNFEIDSRNRLLSMMKKIENEYIHQLKPEELYDYKSGMLELTDKLDFKGCAWVHIMQLMNQIELHYANTFGKQIGYPSTLDEHMYIKTKGALSDNPDNITLIKRDHFKGKKEF